MRNIAQTGYRPNWIPYDTFHIFSFRNICDPNKRQRTRLCPHSLTRSLTRSHASVYICFDFPGDILLISQIRTTANVPNISSYELLRLISNSIWALSEVSERNVERKNHLLLAFLSSFCRRKRWRFFTFSSNQFDSTERQVQIRLNYFHQWHFSMLRFFSLYKCRHSVLVFTSSLHPD